jgi:hypothetical protein
MMKAVTLVAIAAGLLSAQGPPALVYGKITVEGPNISKALYGKAAARIEQAVVYACASGGAVTVQPADFYIHISGATPMSTVDALAIIQQSYGNQTPQKVARDLGIAAGSIGLAVSSGLLSSVSVKALGFLLGGATLLTQEVIPAIAPTGPQLSALIAGTLDQIGPQTLTPGGPCLNAKFYMATPPKGTAYPLEATFSFVPGTAPIGMPATLHHVAIGIGTKKTRSAVLAQPMLEPMQDSLSAEMQRDFAALSDPADREQLIAKWARIADREETN